MTFISCLPTKHTNLELLEEEISDSEDSRYHQPRLEKTQSGGWQNLRIAVLGLYQRQKLGNSVIRVLHSKIRELTKPVQNHPTKPGDFMFDWCRTELFVKGTKILFENVKLNTGKQLLHSVEETWNFFYSETLPTLQAIFLPLQTKKHTIRDAALLQFRDNFVLELDLMSALDEVNFVVSPGIKQMFLILQTVHDVYPPSKTKLKLESLVCRVIIPYLGFKGYYEGGAEPLFESMEPYLAAERRSIADARRASRPMSVQPSQLKSLTDKHKHAIARTTSLMETCSDRN